MQRARETHPDKGGDEEMFKQIRLAYDAVLAMEKESGHMAWEPVGPEQNFDVHQFRQSRATRRQKGQLPKRAPRASKQGGAAVAPSSVQESTPCVDHVGQAFEGPVHPDFKPVFTSTEERGVLHEPFLCSILGVPRGATREELRKAFMQRARETHPDNGGDVDMFIQARQAYTALLGMASHRPPRTAYPRPQSRTGNLEQLFGTKDLRRPRRRCQASSKRQNADRSRSVKQASRCVRQSSSTKTTAAEPGHGANQGETACDERPGQDPEVEVACDDQNVFVKPGPWECESKAAPSVCAAPSSADPDAEAEPVDQKACHEHDGQDRHSEVLPAGRTAELDIDGTIKGAAFPKKHGNSEPTSPQVAVDASQGPAEAAHPQHVADAVGSLREEEVSARADEPGESVPTVRLRGKRAVKQPLTSRIVTRSQTAARTSDSPACLERTPKRGRQTRSHASAMSTDSPGCQERWGPQTHSQAAATEYTSCRQEVPTTSSPRVVVSSRPAGGDEHVRSARASARKPSNIIIVSVRGLMDELGDPTCVECGGDIELGAVRCATLRLHECKKGFRHWQCFIPRWNFLDVLTNDGLSPEQFDACLADLR